MPKESEILSAIAMMNNAVRIVILALIILLKPTMIARLVITAEDAP